MTQTYLATRISFKNEDANEVERLIAELQGVDKETIPGKGLVDPATLILVLFTATALVNLVITISRMWKCGIIVDCRDKEITTQKNCDLPRGQVLVITKEGEKVTLDNPSEADLKPFVEKLG
jgi:hypothetical protein